MNRDEVIKINLENARAVAQGNYNGLLCPKCKKESAEAFFSEHNLKKSYGLWFECTFCGNVEHISSSKKPEGFTPLRVTDKFQEADERAWEAEERESPLDPEP